MNSQCFSLILLVLVTLNHPHPPIRTGPSCVGLMPLSIDALAAGVLRFIHVCRDATLHKNLMEDMKKREGELKAKNH